MGDKEWDGSKTDSQAWSLGVVVPHNDIEILEKNRPMRIRKWVYSGACWDWGLRVRCENLECMFSGISKEVVISYLLEYFVWGYHSFKLYRQSLTYKVQLNDDAKVIRIRQKLYFEFRILIFFWVSKMQHDTLSWCWGAARSSSSQSAAWSWG